MKKKCDKGSKSDQECMYQFPDDIQAAFKAMRKEGIDEKEARKHLEEVMRELLRITWASLNDIKLLCDDRVISKEEAAVELAQKILGYASDMSSDTSGGKVWRDYLVHAWQMYWYNGDYHDEPKPPKQKKPTTTKKSAKSVKSGNQKKQSKKRLSRVESFGIV